MSTEGEEGQSMPTDQGCSEGTILFPWDDNGDNKQGYKPLKKKKTDLKPNFSTLTQIFNEAAQIAVHHGCKFGTYDAALQMKNAIKTYG